MKDETSGARMFALNGTRTLRAPLSFLPPRARGAVSVALMALNTLVCATVLLAFAVVKLVIPVNAVRKRIDPLLNWIATAWIANNGLIVALVRKIHWDVRGVADLTLRRWYLVEANHQSWVDILVLQKVFNRRIPMLKFFLKRQLIWVPVIGLAWWALDFPFMRRHSEAFLREHPERRGDDMRAIRRACEKFALIPTAVINFLEGTRFTPEKQARQGSPYRHLLAPKAGGIALALNAMGERFHALLDVTLFYPGGIPTFFQYMSGRVKDVVLIVREIPIPTELLAGDYAVDGEFRTRVQTWVGELWEEKDRRLEELRAESA